MLNESNCGPLCMIDLGPLGPVFAYILEYT